MRIDARPTEIKIYAKTDSAFYIDALFISWASEKHESAKPPLMRDELPELATELRKLLEREGETVLAAEVQNLVIFDRDDHSHGSDFYTAPRPSGPWGPSHRTLSLRPGALHVDVAGGQIVMVEMLRRRSRVLESDTLRS